MIRIACVVRMWYEHSIEQKQTGNALTASVSFFLSLRAVDNVPNDVPTWGIIVAVCVGVCVLILLLVLVACCAKNVEKKMQKDKDKGHRIDYAPRVASSRKKSPDRKAKRDRPVKAKPPPIGEPEPFLPAYAEEKPQKGKTLIPWETSVNFQK